MFKNYKFLKIYILGQKLFFAKNGICNAKVHQILVPHMVLRKQNNIWGKTNTSPETRLEPI